MIRIEATTTVEELSKALRTLGSKQLPFAMALAATRTAQRVQKGELTVMRQRLHNPTANTMRSIRLKAAKKTGQPALVYFLGANVRQWEGSGGPSFSSGIPANDYLQAITRGGPRRHKRMEKALIARGFMNPSQYAMPTPALLDSHGNVKGSTVIKILSGIGAAEVFSGGGYQANATSSRRSRKKGNAQRYFVGEVDGTNGIWERKKTGFGEAVRPLFVFVDAAPQYRVIVPFFKIAENITKANYQREFTEAMRYAIATATR